MSFGFKDMVYGTLCPAYGAYKMCTTDMKEYKQFAQDAHNALYRDADGSFNPIKAAVHTASPLMMGVTLWQNTGKEPPPPQPGRAVYSYPEYSAPRITRPAVGAGS